MQSDDDDSSQASSKNLASLFEKNSSYGGNSSLMYKPPKQPKSKVESAPRISPRPQAKAKETLGLITLKVLQTYKFVKNAYVDQGKVGVAISGSPSTRLYQLTLYKEKTSHLAQAHINSQFWFAVQPNKYATFRDRNNILWSLLFDSSASLVEFSTEVALAKWACTEGVDTMVSQDLYSATCSADEQKVGADSRVEVALRVSTISPAYKLDKEIDTKEKCIINISNSDSWSGSLVGLVKGNKKLIILPPNLQGKWKSSLQQNESIALEVEILAVDPSPPSIPKEISKPLPETSITQVTEESLPNLSDISGNSATPKNQSLISRMAKVGQALPFKGARVPDASDSEDDVKAPPPVDQSVEQNRIEIEPIEEPKTSSAPEPSVAAMKQENAPLPSIPSQQVVAPVASSTVATSQPLALDPQFAVFFSELRTNNSELRMGMNRITDKVERVIDKIEVSSLDRVLDQLRNMETNMVSQFNIAQQKNAEMIHSLKENKYRNPESQQHNSVEHLMQENKELQEALAQSSSKVQELQENIADLNKTKSDLNEQLMREKQTREIMEQEHASAILKLQTQLSEQAKTLALWSEALDKVSQRVPDLERKVERERRKVESEKQRTIRRLMNDVYKKMCSQFPDESAHYTATLIHDTIRDTIKETTFQYLSTQNRQNREDECKNEVESIPSVSSTSNSVVEKYDEGNRKDNNASSMEQGSPSQINPTEKDAAETNESIAIGKKHDIELDRNNEYKDGIDSVNGTSLKDKDVHDNTDLPSESDQIISIKQRDNNNETRTDLTSPSEEAIKVTGKSSEENWSPKHPPPFNNEDSESDDGWLN
ncbi:FK506-binding protein 15 isoform X1 [Nilaparvata lugens]|uniref:FK506-binding protein 15 isoform X1 n=1 Tax=Nilaparvata lugens TaxID=108931 RepID=UPI00193DD252|nr:FK506-binding protein 15 isoform X1 [Nilaparvata lugens]XP_039286204.1 FK506-binding protein 15 isoform X1 [Nilaparvata lugens]XP_039286205.1 FK506-binding protein 15 isoform X1 [Nilaparvata lugens]